MFFDLKECSCRSGERKSSEIQGFQSFFFYLLFTFAVRTGLEPVTPCVTGMYSNQLN